MGKKGNLTFKDEEAAINYAVAQTSGKIKASEIEARIQQNQKFLEQAGDEDKGYWRKQVDELVAWSKSEEFKNGDYPSGLDELILTLADYRSMVFAFRNSDVGENKFVNSIFFQQWLIGSAYVIATTIGKLVSKHPLDNSLRSLWESLIPYLETSTLGTKEEYAYLTGCLDQASGHFTNEKSKAVYLRNKQVSHNEASPTTMWSDIDLDIKILVRMWSLIVMWCSNGINSPFRDSKTVFQGLESNFSSDEMTHLQSNYEKSSAEIRVWAEVDIIGGKRISRRSPFANLTVSISIG